MDAAQAKEGGLGGEESRGTLLIPARMLNEYVYCPRLFALEWIERNWSDTPDTLEGSRVHRQVDRPDQRSLPEPNGDGDPEPQVVRSVLLGDPELHLVAKIDLVEARGGELVPVDYKKSKAPKVEGGAWLPERVQVCAQGLLLRAHGYKCDHGVLYFHGSRKRVEVPFTDELVQQTRDAVRGALQVAQSEQLPPPLVDDRKCPRCAMVEICLPDEHNFLTGRSKQVRPLIPPRDDALPLYVRRYGGSLGKDHDEVVVKEKGKVVGRARLEEISRVVILGNVSVSTPLLNEFARRGIPVSFHSYGGWFYGVYHAAGGINVMTRIAQHRAFQDPKQSLELARSFVHSKILNSRVLLRRNGEAPKEALRLLKLIAEDVEHAEDIGSLLGLEGAAAAVYFKHFKSMIRGDLRETFQMDGRNRRPPRDPVNALLSFAYSMLAREITTILLGIGLDAHVGFLHRPRYGRPSLALDLMEEFRPVLAESAVVTAINTRVVDVGDFLYHPTGVALRDAARRRFIQVFERRLDEFATHPVFETRLSYRRILEVQARLLGKVLLGELPSYPEFRIR